MQTLVALVAAVVLLVPAVAMAQNATIEAAARTLGAPAVKSIEFTGGGFICAAGQAATPGTEEKLRSQADVFTPPTPNAPPPAAVNPNTVHLADHIARLGLAVDQHLPRHGRIVPFADLHNAIGRDH